MLCCKCIPICIGYLILIIIIVIIEFLWKNLLRTIPIDELREKSLQEITVYLYS